MATLRCILACGFKQGEEEALMVAPPTDLPETLFRPHSNQITIKELTDESMIDDVFAIETAVWKSTHRNRAEMISNLQDSLKRDVGFIAYFKEQPAGVFCGEESPIVPQLFCPVSLIVKTSAFSRTKDDDEHEDESSISEFRLNAMPSPLYARRCTNDEPYDEA
jgi:hypothetical protein